MSLEGTKTPEVVCYVKLMEGTGMKEEENNFTVTQ